MSLSLPPVSVFELFADSLLEGLYEASCKREKFRDITDATIGNTIRFMRLRRLEGITSALSADELWQWEMRCEDALLKTVEGATSPRRTKKGRRKDPDVGNRFVQTLLLREEGKTFPAISKLMPEFATPDAHRKLFDRHVKDFRSQLRKKYPALVKDLDATLEKVKKKKRTK